MTSWFAINDRWGACGLGFERGHDEEHDYWRGAYTLAIDLIARPAQPEDFT